MGVQKVTTRTTEADLEARIDATLRKAFPLLPRHAIQHQTKFKFTLGGKDIPVNGATNWTSVQARADVIVYFHDKPLAVLELKRPGSTLSAEDRRQGLSYARILDQQAPLVVVTNGDEVQMLETHTGKRWDNELSENALAKVMQSAVRVAEGELKEAIANLMGTNPDIWAQALRQVSAEEIANLSGVWRERTLPFVNGFLIPRKATAAVRWLLDRGTRLIIVDGRPMIGKSNVLRELAESTTETENSVVLFVSADHPSSILQLIADTLEDKLNWPVTKEEARGWLKRISDSTSGPKLVIAIDGIGLDFDRHRDQIADLCTTAFGKNLAMVVELDDTIADRAVLDSAGRRASRIGRLVKRVRVKPLDHEEFDGACEELRKLHIGISHGGQLSPEYRLPWVLRAVASHFPEWSASDGENMVRMMHPLLSLQLIKLARQTFDGDAELRRRMQGVALAAIEDASDRERLGRLVLEAIRLFIVRRSTLEKHLSEGDIQTLLHGGFLKASIHETGDAVVTVRVPELVASEIAWTLAKQLEARKESETYGTALWLGNVAGSLPFGDISAAQALVDLAVVGNGFPIDLMMDLLGKEPKLEKTASNFRGLADVPGVGILDMTVTKDGFVFKDRHGKDHLVRFESSNPGDGLYSDPHPWLILSHLATIPFAAVNTDDGSDIQRVDPFLLLRVGSCTMILRRPAHDQELEEVLAHHLPEGGEFVCHRMGIVEPIAFAIFNYLGREGCDAEPWIDAALSWNSLPLLARTDIALRQLENSTDTGLAEFASKMQKSVGKVLAKVIEPH